MCELCLLFENVQDGQCVTLEQNAVYHVRQEDAFILSGMFCSNTAKVHENPDGTRIAAVYLQNKKDIVIDGNGATVLVHGKMTPFVFDRCENITVRNLTVDYACPTMTEFTVLSNENGVCELQFNADCRFCVRENELIWQGEDSSDGTPYWEDRAFVQGRYVKVFDPAACQCRDFPRDDLRFASVEQTGEHTVRVTLQNKDADFVPGHIFQTRNIVRDQTGGLFNRCKDLIFEDLRIRFMHGLGMVSQFCENVTFRNCDFTPAEGRTIASTADFFQFSGCRGDLVIEACKANGAQDDYVNVHGTHLRIVETDTENNSITVRFMHAETWGIQAFEVGDTLEFIKWDTLVPFAETVVTAWEKRNDTDILLHLDRALPDVEIDKDVVENATWTPNLYVRNCDFGVTAGRGILCTTRGEVIIENNRFYHLWGPALLLEDDCNFWFESGYTKHIVFRNNEVIGCDYGHTDTDSPVIRYSPKVLREDSTAFVHGKLTVSGNTFKEATLGVHTLRLAYLECAEITDNTFDAPYGISAHCTGEIIDKNNTVPTDEAALPVRETAENVPKRIEKKRIVALLLAAILLFSCGFGGGTLYANRTATAPKNTSAYAENPAYEYMAGALAWQMSAETQALIQQSFNVANNNIEQLSTLAKKNSGGYSYKTVGSKKQMYYSGRRVAVVCEVDSTLLNTALFTAAQLQSERELTNKDYYEFLQSDACEALPGAVEFANNCIRNGIAVFYVTNRTDLALKTTQEGYIGQTGYKDAQGNVLGASVFDVFGKTAYDLTVQSLSSLGFPVNDKKALHYAEDAVVLLNDPLLGSADKQVFRDAIENGETVSTGERGRDSEAYLSTLELDAYRIVMLLGDDLNDMSSLFNQDGEDAVSRVQYVYDYADKWGTEWIVFPDATGGSAHDYAAAYGYRAIAEAYAPVDE